MRSRKAKIRRGNRDRLPLPATAVNSRKRLSGLIEEENAR
nr:MAG TPA: hypothetical protein [Caudoviricetes sp.]